MENPTKMDDLGVLQIFGTGGLNHVSFFISARDHQIYGSFIIIEFSCWGKIPLNLVEKTACLHFSYESLKS